MVGQWLAIGWRMPGQLLYNGLPMVGEGLANGWPMAGQWLANGFPGHYLCTCSILPPDVVLHDVASASRCCIFDAEMGCLNSEHKTKKNDILNACSSHLCSSAWCCCIHFSRG